MKNDKYYRQKREKIKDKKRNMKNLSFESTEHRKSHIEDLKREYRSERRSEKQDVKKFIDDELE